MSDWLQRPLARYIPSAAPLQCDVCTVARSKLPYWRTTQARGTSPFAGTHCRLAATARQCHWRSVHLIAVHAVNWLLRYLKETEHKHMHMKPYSYDLKVTFCCWSWVTCKLPKFCNSFSPRGASDWLIRMRLELVQFHPDYHTWLNYAGYPFTITGITFLLAYTTYNLRTLLHYVFT